MVKLYKLCMVGVTTHAHPHIMAQPLYVPCFGMDNSYTIDNGILYFCPQTELILKLISLDLLGQQDLRLLFVMS